MSEDFVRCRLDNDEYEKYHTCDYWEPDATRPIQVQCCKTCFWRLNNED